MDEKFTPVNRCGRGRRFDTAAERDAYDKGADAWPTPIGALGSPESRGFFDYDEWLNGSGPEPGANDV